MFEFLGSKLRMELAEIKHKHALELDAKNKDFERAKKNWEEDRVRLENKLTEDFELKQKEAITLLKLESQQKIKQLELDSQRDILKIKQDSVTQISDLKVTLAQEFYSKMTDSMTKLHEDGNQATKFTQELALKMLEKAPAAQTTRREKVKIALTEDNLK